MAVVFLWLFISDWNSKIKKASTILIGDFNMTKIGWEYSANLFSCLSTNATSESYDKAESTFLDEIVFNNLSQCNYIKNDLGRILDLVITDSPKTIKINECLAPLTKLDSPHPALEIEVCQPKNCKSLRRNRTPILNFNKANYSGINEELSMLEWENIWENEMSVDQMVNSLYSTLMPIIEKNTPRCTP
ncbi:putative reverse transcriptase [Operophtera brumata]|uniref:Putative reverse transcriptase n=1 Tax=Operophtera brumata TaxID=104452 RepID=A0A0L7KU20_OPEBR|nr:putative reverse transcriptase [Operophtera brumata]